MRSRKKMNGNISGNVHAPRRTAHTTSRALHHTLLPRVAHRAPKQATRARCAITIVKIVVTTTTTTWATCRLTRRCKTNIAHCLVTPPNSSRDCCYQTSPYAIDDLFFVGHPVCADAHGTWTFKRSNRRDIGIVISTCAGVESASSIECLAARTFIVRQV
jgi:hypothetical protein